MHVSILPLCNTINAIRLLRMGADPNYLEDKDGWGAIHYAARWGDMKMLKACRCEY